MKQKILLPALMLLVGIAAGAIGGRMTAEPTAPGKTPTRAAEWLEYRQLTVRMCVLSAKWHLEDYPDDRIGDGSPEAWIAYSGNRLGEIECRKVVEEAQRSQN